MYGANRTVDTDFYGLRCCQSNADFYGLRHLKLTEVSSDRAVSRWHCKDSTIPCKEAYSLRCFTSVVRRGRRTGQCPLHGSLSLKRIALPRISELPLLPLAYANHSTHTCDRAWPDCCTYVAFVDCTMIYCS